MSATDMRSGVALIDGCAIAWEEKGTGFPVLFIHGTAASIWGDTFDRVASQGRAIRYDRRGFGKSSHPPISDLSRHASDAAALLTALDVRRAIVVGWSIGGVVAAELAVRHPTLVSGLVLLEPPLWAKKHPDLGLLNGVVGSILLGFVGGPAQGGRRFTRWVLTERGGRNSLDTATPSVQQAISENAAAVGVEIRGGTGEHLSASMLASIEAPTVVLAGDRSRPFFAASARRMADMIPGARLMALPGASHMLQTERPGDIGDAVGGLIKLQVPQV